MKREEIALAVLVSLASSRPDPRRAAHEAFEYADAFLAQAARRRAREVEERFSTPQADGFSEPA